MESASLCRTINPLMPFVIASRLPCLAFDIMGMQPNLIASMSEIGKPSPRDGSKKMLASERIFFDTDLSTLPICLMRLSLGRQSLMSFICINLLFPPAIYVFPIQ